MKIRDKYTCPLELTHDLVKGKWKPIILWQLGKDTMPLARLEKDIEGISQKMLLEQLGELVESGFAGKNNFEGYPLRVEYFITERGKKMLEAISIMQEVGIEILVENGMRGVLVEKGLIEP